MYENEIQQNNMISNLPLLFANGYPTSLEKISECQLERFIPFMVQCSLGYLNLQSNVECSEPEWWPEDVSFDLPFKRPKQFTGNWKEKMKEIVIICYQFHKSIFLLRFCTDLAAYEHASLRFINNCNSTTSLFDRRNNKLLVTFRNENMAYDQIPKPRKCLLQQRTKAMNTSLPQNMVQSPPFDIYLCDHCDAELYSKDAIYEHEKSCKNVDRVIVCTSFEDLETDQEKYSSQPENDELRKRFLSNFNLRDRNDKYYAVLNGHIFSNSSKKDISVKNLYSTFGKRNRTAHSLTRYSSIPLSSPAGLRLVDSSKTLDGTEYLLERLERVERFCSTPILSKNQLKPRFFDRKITEPHCTFKLSSEARLRVYSFPRRQYLRRNNFLYSLMKNPIPKKIKSIKLDQRKTNYNFNIKLHRDLKENSKWEVMKSGLSGEIIVETIDLCSSEDEDISSNITTFQSNHFYCENITETDIGILPINFTPPNFLRLAPQLQLANARKHAANELWSRNITLKDAKKMNSKYETKHQLFYSNIDSSRLQNSKFENISKVLSAPSVDMQSKSNFSDKILPNLLVPNLDVPVQNILCNNYTKCVKNTPKESNSYHMGIVEHITFSDYKNMENPTNLRSFKIITEMHPSIIRSTLTSSSRLLSFIEEANATDNSEKSVENMFCCKKFKKFNFAKVNRKKKNVENIL